jgi:hypothetical protein
MTSTGIVFIPIIGLIFLLWPSRLEELLIYMSVFQAAAVANLGGGFAFGLSPYFFTASLLAARVTLKWLSGNLRFQRGEFAQSHFQIAALFIGWAVLSAFLMPVLFAGTPSIVRALALKLCSTLRCPCNGVSATRARLAT